MVGGFFCDRLLDRGGQGNMTALTRLAAKIYGEERAAGYSRKEASRSADAVFFGSVPRETRIPAVTVGEPQPPEWVPEGCELEDGQPDDPFVDMPDEVWWAVGEPPEEEA